MFAILQSAGAGGAGAGVLGGTVFGTTSLAAWGLTIPKLIAASTNDQNGDNHGNAQENQNQGEISGEKKCESVIIEE